MTISTDTKREEIKARIAAAQAREERRNSQSLVARAGETASEATDAVTDFVKKHPFAAAAGGVAVGILIASMFKGPRQAAARGGRRAAGLATAGAEIAGGFASQMIDDAAALGREGARRAEDFADTAGDRTRSIGRSASRKVGDATDAARIARRETGKAIARALGRR